MASWLDTLAPVTEAPRGLDEWARAQPGFDAAWRACRRPDWLLWLAAANRPSPAVERELVAAACSSVAAMRGGRLQGWWRPGPPPLERALATVTPGLEHQLPALFVDFVQALVAAALIAVPLSIALSARFAPLGAARRVGYTDAISLPALAAALVAFFVVLRAWHVARVRRARRTLDFAAALGIGLAELGRAVERRGGEDVERTGIVRGRVEGAQRRGG
jgi:hypothetical protein